MSSVRSILEEVRTCLQWAIVFLLLTNVAAWAFGYESDGPLQAAGAAAGVAAFFAAGRPRTRSG